eukprot:GHVQ01023919.1.p1 GENE.GHVQ01023919.1~~GHVQ01023919.1.p1  ORF type:complete len:305 (-),score=36.57 GHVQ01023919.1:522-1436(-)
MKASSIVCCVDLGSLILSLFLSCITAAAQQDVCLASMGFVADRPRDRQGQFAECLEHHRRSCCERRHTENISQNLVSAKDGGLSEKCLEATRVVWCGRCDGDVGIGRLSRGNVPILCSELCEKWYGSCVDDYYAAGGSANSLLPCANESVVCSRLLDVTKDSATFCRLSGFEVFEEVGSGKGTFGFCIIVLLFLWLLVKVRAKIVASATGDVDVGVWQGTEYRCSDSDSVSEIAAAGVGRSNILAQASERRIAEQHRAETPPGESSNNWTGCTHGRSSPLSSASINVGGGYRRTVAARDEECIG